MNYPNNRKEVNMNQPLECFGTHSSQLPTSRFAKGQERNVLPALRALAPRRRLAPLEIRIVAELQANRLLQLAGLREAPIPHELITELPRIAVRQDADLPVSGTALWIAGRWLICLNATEPWTRQRYSLAHELKHVIDHRHAETLYANEADAENAAEYFSACLLMPKRAVYAAWAFGNQATASLANTFQVHPRAMAHRLHDLGLRSHPKLPRRTQGRRTGTRSYYTRQPQPARQGAIS
jgi:Zn-dependent peptidase ImmA (M78 family)